MDDAQFSRLSDAVARNAAVALTLPSAGMARHYKSRFLAMSEAHVWVESISNEAVLLDEMIRGGKPIIVEFRAGENIVTFSSTVVAREKEHRLAGRADVLVEALQLACPAELKSVQRRTYFRVRTKSAEVSARVWRIGRNADAKAKLMPDQEVRTEIKDLSLGGMGVLFHGKEGHPARVVDGEDVRVELRSEQGVLVLDGRVRCAATAGSGASKRAGIQWTAAEKTLQGRQTLTQLARIIAGIEREELRRSKLGLSA